MGELELKARLLVEEVGKFSKLQTWLDAKVDQADSPKHALEVKKAVLKAKVQECGHLELKLGTAWAAIGRGDWVFHDLAEHECTRYESLMRQQSSSYRNRVNVLMSETLLHSKYYAV